MREFVFTVEYDEGADPVTDVFIEYPELHARTITCHVSQTGLWRLDRIAGPADALARLDDIFTDPVHCNECIGERHCHTNWEYEILSADKTRRTVYTYRPAASDCHSIPHLAVCYLGDGVLFDAERHENRYEWRLLIRDDESVRDLYDALAAELREGLTLQFEQVGTPSRWTDEAIMVAELPYKQRVAAEAAVEYGYYQTPRETTVQELAEMLGVPRSTLQYRLQQAESRIVRQFVSQPMTRPTLESEAEPSP